MDSNSIYSGVVTLLSRVGNKTVATKHYNHGTNRLFEAYARALAGQSINNYIPRYIHVFGEYNGNEIGVCKTPIPLLVSYKSADADGGNYGAPYLRTSTVLTKGMLKDISSGWGDTFVLRLYNAVNPIDATEPATDTMLAEVSIEGLKEAISNMTPGVQLILLWDLYVTNKPDEEPTEPEEGEEE